MILTLIKTACFIIGTASVAVLKDLGAIVRPLKLIDQAQCFYVRRLKPLFLTRLPFFSARSEGAGKVSVVEPLFDIQYYGFLFPEGSETGLTGRF